jgi:ATP-dependent Clp protease ATP-binding subunit ClpA
LKKGYDKKYGSRPLKRAIERYLGDPLSDAILEGKIKKGNQIKISFKKNKIFFSIFYYF